jgi:uncharacterized membrane protein YdjX (TVP38/TMEM64 family)
VKRAAALRLGALGIVLGGAWVAGKVTGIADGLTAQVLRDRVLEAGAWGATLYIATSVVASFLQLPAWIWVGGAVFAYGHALGWLAAYVAAVLAAATTFWLVRGIGGQPIATVQKPWVRRILAHLDAHPVRTVFLLRLLVATAPPVSYALALSGMRFRDYFVGSAVGLVVPIAFMSVVLDWFIN